VGAVVAEHRPGPYSALFAVHGWSGNLGRMGDTITGADKQLATDRAEHDDTHADDELIDDELIEDELLVEEISIDGMCGVY
jgi:mycofactocin precursor